MIMCALLSMVYGLFKPCWLTDATCNCFKETALLLNVHLGCFVNFIKCPTDKYVFKVNNEKIRLICWMCSKLKSNTTWHCSNVFIVDFDQNQYINTVFLLWTLNKYFSLGCERHVIMFWKCKKRHICFVIKIVRFISFSDFIIAPNLNKFWANNHNKHIVNICFSSKFALRIASVLSSFLPAIWSALSSLLP